MKKIPRIHCCLVWLGAVVLVANLSCKSGMDKNAGQTRGEALLKLTFSEGEVSNVEILGVYDEGVLRSLGRLQEKGEVEVRLEDSHYELASGWIPDPRSVYVDRLEPGNISGGIITLEQSQALLVVPAPAMGRGELEFNLMSAAGTPVTTKFDLNMIDQTVKKQEIFDLDPLVNLEFMGGSTDVEHAFLIVFLPLRYDDLNVFREDVIRELNDVFSHTWYADHQDSISNWLAADEAMNAMPYLGCSALAEEVLVGYALAASEMSILYYDGVFRMADRVVLVVNDDDPECRSMCWAHGNIILYRTSIDWSSVLAHELGHSIGGLEDEYESDTLPPCWAIKARGLDPNTGTADDIPWSCIRAGMSYEALCLDGSPVDAYAPVLGCDDIFRPCQDCLMRCNNRNFCPVCEASMTAKFRKLLGNPMTDDPCNGTDDDFDGETDEGCVCELVDCIPSEEVCDDGVDNDCDGEVDEGCEGCGNDACEPPDEDCSTCPEDCGACPPTCPNGICEADESCSSCPADCGDCPPTCPNGTCDADENCTNCPADCGDCPVPCPNGICDTDETCETCPEDCGECGPDCVWFSCTNSCWPTGTSSGEACATPTSINCGDYTTVSECDAHGVDCAWYSCSYTCWRRGTPEQVACNNCDAYTTLEQCDAHAPDCAWYACSSSCWPTGTPNDVACPDCGTLTTVQECDAHGTICAWYFCSNTCWPRGTPNDVACPDCSIQPTVTECDAHAPVCAWYACTNTCWPRGTSNEMACNECSMYRTAGDCG